MDRQFMNFIEEAIETAREVGEEKRGQSRAAQMKQIERQQQGQTKRTQLQTQAQRDIARLKESNAAQRDGTADKGISKSQMAKFRTDALSGAQEQLEGMRDLKGGIIHPITQEIMTADEEQNYAKSLADSMLSYSFGGQSSEQVAQGQAGQQGSGWVEAEGGRRFEVAPGARRGFIETTSAQTDRLPIASAGQIAPPAIQGQEASPASPAGVVAPRVPFSARPSGSTAAMLRSEYEKKRQAEIPSLAGTIGRGLSKVARKVLHGAPTQRAVAPLGLRGYMENAYNQ